MFRTIAAKIERDTDYPARQWTIDIYTRVNDGVFYDHLTSAFHDEKNQAGEYIPLRQRRPSVTYNLARLVVDDSVSLLFSEGHFPTPDCKDEALKEALTALVKQSALNEVMLESATVGAVGSVAIHMKVLQQEDKTHQVFYEPHSTEYLTPTFDKRNPRRLVNLVEAYKVKGSQFDASYGLTDEQKAETFWFRREWDENEETWFKPLSVADAKEGKKPQRDPQKSVRHGLGFVPWVWVKNLPGKLRLIQPDGSIAYSDCDGACTFTAALNTMIEVDYQLSQAGRGLKYSMDPTLLLKEPAAPEGAEFVKSPANAIVVDKDGDAKMLEIGGEAFKVVLDYVRAARELALEQIHGNRTDPQKLATATSGRAMEMMNQALIWLADRLRVSYGEGALLSLLKMTLKAHEKFPISLADGTPLPKLAGEKAAISLNWPDWYPQTPEDRQAEATTLNTLTKGSLLSRKTAVKSLASEYDIEDVDAEVAEIDADIQRGIEVLAAQGAQTKTTEEAED